MLSTTPGRSIRLIELLLRHATHVPADLFDYIGRRSTTERQQYLRPLIARPELSGDLLDTLLEEATEAFGEHAVAATQLVRGIARGDDPSQCLATNAAPIAAFQHDDDTLESWMTGFFGNVFDLTQPGDPARAALLNVGSPISLAWMAAVARTDGNDMDALAALQRIDADASREEPGGDISWTASEAAAPTIRALASKHREALIQLRSAWLVLPVLLELGTNAVRTPDEARHVLAILVDEREEFAPRPTLLVNLTPDVLRSVVAAADPATASKTLKALRLDESDTTSDYLDLFHALRSALAERADESGATTPALAVRYVDEFIYSQAGQRSAADWLVATLTPAAHRWDVLAQFTEEAPRDRTLEDIVIQAAATTA